MCIFNDSPSLYSKMLFDMNLQRLYVSSEFSICRPDSKLHGQNCLGYGGQCVTSTVKC